MFSILEEVVSLLLKTINKLILLDTFFSCLSMSSQQSINCDTYQIRANEITIQSDGSPIELSNVSLTGDLSLDNLTIGETLILTKPLVEPSVYNITLDGSWAQLGYLDITKPVGMSDGGITFGDNTYLSMPRRSTMSVPAFYLSNSCEMYTDNGVSVTGPIVSGNLFHFRFVRLQNFVFYDLRMSGGTAQTFTATNATITTEASIKTDYRPNGYVYGADNPSTVISLQALINGVIVNLMGQVKPDGSMLITRPGGTFTLGETFYLLEASGTWITLV